MAKKDILSSPRLLELKKKRRQIMINKMLLLLTGVIVVIVFVFYFSRIDGLNIVKVEVTGNKILEAQMLEQFAEEQLRGSYAFLIPKTNVLFYPQKTISQELRNKFSGLNEINLAIKNRSTLTVEVTEREAKYTWCGIMENIYEGSREKCYFMDETGYIFNEAPYFSGEVYFKFYGAGEILDLENPKGNYLIKDKFASLVAFKEVVEKMKLQPAQMNISDNNEVEIYLSKRGAKSHGPVIKIKSDADLKNVAENLQTALTTEPLLSGIKNKYSSLLYIDLRFGNKVYFKFNE